MGNNYFAGDPSLTPIPGSWFNNPANFNLNGIRIPNNPRYRSAYDADNYELAMLSELEGEYEDAATLYWNAATVDEYQPGLNGWARCQEMLGTSDEDILATIEGLLDDETLNGTAFWMQMPYQNRMGDFEESILDLDGRLAVAEGYEDSAAVLMGQLETYLMMAIAEEDGMEVNSVRNSDEGFSLEPLGVCAEIVPSDMADYNSKKNDLITYMTSGRKGNSLRSGSELPTEFALHQNYPNPFNPTTTLSFDLVRPETVKLSVYNIMGQKVAKLVDRPMQAGTHSVNFNASALASGMYFYRIEAGAFTDMKRMVLVK